MRHYQAGAKVYIFGFSRGAYTARFLNEMLDHVGLLGPDNEEVVPFIWDAFVSWKLGRTDHDDRARRNAFAIMKQSREILSRPMVRVHFLGMFDAVNSIADFDLKAEARPSTMIVRHAVSIDERRIKFRPVLLQSDRESWTRDQLPDEKKASKDTSTGDSDSTTGPPILPEIPNIAAYARTHEAAEDDEGTQDIEEMWFPGCHADIGGGWSLRTGEIWPLTHAPLVWMVQEARRAGLRLDKEKMAQHYCIEDLHFDSNEPTNLKEREALGLGLSNPFRDYLHALHVAAKDGKIHDLLAYGNGLSFRSVLSWRFMEYLPLKRTEPQPDGSWKAVRWPPPRGRARDIPVNARIHVSAIQRMKSDSSYRPDNLAFDTTQDTNGIGNWIVHSHEGDPLRERYIRG